MAPPETLTLHEAAERLGVHYMTAYRYVRTGQLRARRDGSKWMIDAADLHAPTLEPDPAAPGRRSRVDRATRLRDRMTKGDEAGAWTVVEGALSSGVEPDAVYRDLLVPALEAVGEGWERGEISVTEEHLASVVATRLIGRLGPRFARRGRSRGSVVVGAPSGELHMLPSAMLGDLLRAQGFEPVNLGANTPADSFVEAALGADRLVAVLLGATTSEGATNLRASIDALRAAEIDVPILVGGRAVVDERSARALGADGWSGRDAAHALVAVENLMG